MAWTTPRTWVASEIVTAALLNTHLRDNLNAIGGAWTSYGSPSTLWTASTTNPTIGNGSCTGRVMEAGKWIAGSISIVFGSTTTVGSGSYIFLLPTSAQNFRCLTGNCELLDAPSSAIPRTLLGTTATTFAVADFTPTRLAHNSPLAWATGDRIDIGFVYEGA